jgi:hypothetical protein
MVAPNYSEQVRRNIAASRSVMVYFGTKTFWEPEATTYMFSVRLAPRLPIRLTSSSAKSRSRIVTRMEGFTASALWV